MAARVNLTELQNQIGLMPNTGGNVAIDALTERLNEETRFGGSDGSKPITSALKSWLIANGIPSESMRFSKNHSLASAYCSSRYRASWRSRVNPSWSDVLSFDDEGESATPDTIKEDNEDNAALNKTTTTKAPSTDTNTNITSTASAIAKAAETVLVPRLQNMEKSLEKILDNKIASRLREVKLELSNAAKAEICNLATSSAQALIDKLMPPRRIEVFDTSTSTALDLGIQHEMFPRLLRACQARNSDGNRLNILLSGPAGTGKTTAARAVATALSLDFGSDSSLDADYKVVGHKNASGHFEETEFYRILTKGGVYCADEIDNWNASAATALNPAFGNGWCTFPIGMRKRHRDCIIIACANTWGLGATSDYVGRNKLDAATLDRLQPKIYWPIDEKLERAIAQQAAGSDGIAWCELVQQMRRKAQSQGLKVLITPRATFTGIALLSQGFDQTEVMEMVITASLSPDQKKAISGEYTTQPTMARDPANGFVTPTTARSWS
jgi:cobaltochelatase CobS